MPARIAPLALAVVLLTLPAVRAADEPKVVIEKAVKAHGGKDALAKYPAAEYKVEGNIAPPDGSPKFTGSISYQLPDKARVAFTVTAFGEKSVVVQTVDGDGVKSTLNGAAQTLDAKMKAELLQVPTNQLLMLLYPLLDEKSEFTLKEAKGEKVGKVDAVGVLVSKKGMKDVTLFFDPATGLLAKSARKALSPDGKEVVQEVVLEEMKEFGGVKMPTVHKVTQDGKEFMTLKVVDVKFLDKIDAAQFSTK